jgi:23S rRNA A1618 N6-methylase RlmF
MSSQVAAARPANHGSKSGGKRKRKRRHAKGGDARAKDKPRSCAIKPPDPPSTEDDPTHHLLNCTSTLEINFHDFAERHPDFREAWADLKKRGRETLSEESSVSFSTHVDSAFNVALTRAVLSRNFDLSLPSMPEGYLCPPVPNRLNYVLWLNHLLEQSSDERYFEQQPAPSSPAGAARRRIGIDIGCGASCIYPLLLTTNSFQPIGADPSSESANRWTFLATDIDEQSIQSAAINVKANGLQDRIELALVPKTRRQMLVAESDANSSENDTEIALSKCTPGPLATAVEAYAQVLASKTGLDADAGATSSNTGTAISFDFCMTNPPFYSTGEEATTDRKGDGRSRTEMNIGEGVYPGGELRFVRDMMIDSQKLTDGVTWYTSMVSKKSSLVELERELRSQLGRGAVRTATFVQGKTTRWGIAWTYRCVAPRSPAVRARGGLHAFVVEIPSKANDTHGSIDEVLSRIISYCQWMGEYKKLDVVCKVGKKGGDIAEVSIGEQGDKGDCADASGSSIGAFIIDITLKAIEANEARVDGDAGGKRKSLVSVKLQCYCHSPSGGTTIETFRSSLEGEIKRSNRRWRRKLERAEDP